MSFSQVARRAGAAAAMGAALVLLIPGVALAAPGDLDPGFGSGGKVTTDFGGDDVAEGVAVQPDGKIVVIGRTIGVFALARYNSDGSLDSGFGSGGKVTTDFGGDDSASAVALQPDGEIVVVGHGGPGGDFALARYNSDGTLDSSFGADGRVTTDFGGSGDAALAVALQADGKIVAAGAGGGTFVFALARYNSDGSLDSGFGSGGKVTTDLTGASEHARTVAVQSDGMIVAAGRSGGAGDFAVVRYNADGGLDSGFGTLGVVTTSFGTFEDFAEGMALQSDGKILAAGYSGGTDSDFALVRYNGDGTLDPGFGSGGKVTTDFASGGSDGANAVVLQADGKIVAAGRGVGTFALSRYDSDGSLDPGFGSGGKVTTDFGTSAATAVALQADSKIVAAGFSGLVGGDFALARYESGGGGPTGVDLSVTKAGPETASLGDQTSYIVTVTNNGTTAATDVTLEDTLTGPGALVSAAPSQGTCTTTAAGADCALGSLAPGDEATVTVVVEPTATGTVSDTATVSAAEPDPEPADNTATVTTTVDNSHGCTIIGTGDADSLGGTSGVDVICALGGDDTISGRSGADTVHGGSGDDIVVGGSGADTQYGGPGNDTLNGGSGGDTLNGGPGNDILNGESGADLLDTVDDVSGNDAANGGSGTDTCTTDPGDTRTRCP
ncbi:hypothetical protein [Nonomuraea sp. NPDC049400]|uniref:hypothetical protein n=1 Tax=Nonomuraea sp. NPDC049400 TaxID=3364352 RepID=UPI0037A4C822